MSRNARGRTFVLGLALSTLTASLAGAETPSKGDVRRDPNGVTGVSPLWERIAKADAAVAARDLDGALALYREAIATSPEHPLGHYRLGQIEMLRGNPKEAEVAYTAALGFASKDPALRAKISFALAAVHERLQAFDQAIARYEEYEAIARGNPKVKTFPPAAAERKKQNQAIRKNQEDSAAVRARIEKRAKEAEEAARKAR